jgi:NAD(P)-dependent dehydrogenase (short-subunit alcohol dehydrogenase family)
MSATERMQDGTTRRLSDEVAVVTGGGGGLGRAIAGRLASDGAAVAVLDIDADAGQATASEITSRGGRGLSIPCDVTQRDQVRAAMAAVVRSWGKISVLVNNAGIGMHASFLEMSDSTWGAVLAVNLTGAFIVAQEAAREMVREGYGSIINMGSAAAQMAHSEQAAYATSKAGMEALTRVMAFELAPSGVRVNAVAPGTIATEFLSRMLSDGARAERVRRIPMGRLGRPEEVASVVSFLASRDSAYITGSVLPIDGGIVFAGIRA